MSRQDSVAITAFSDAVEDDLETVTVEISGVTNCTEDGEQSGTTTIVEGLSNILEIPTLSWVGKMAMALLASLLGFLTLRRRG